MDVDDALRRAAADLRTAAASPRLEPAPVRRDTSCAPVRTRVLVAATTTVAVLAVWLTWTGSTHQRAEPPAAPSSTAPPVSSCGSGSLPMAVHPPDGWHEASGETPGTLPRAGSGQLVVRFTGPDGAQVETRWPAAPDRDDRPWSDTLSTGDLLVGTAADVPFRVGSGVGAVAVLTAGRGTGPCRYVAVTWSGRVPDGYGTGWGVFAEPGDTAEHRRAGQGLTEFVRGEPHVVAGLDQVSSAPRLPACSDATMSPSDVRQGDEVRDQVPLSTPEAALQRMLALDPAAVGPSPSLPPPPYRKAVGPAGRVWYTATEDGSAVVVDTERTAAGWVVTSWTRQDPC